MTIEEPLLAEKDLQQQKSSTSYRDKVMGSVNVDDIDGHSPIEKDEVSDDDSMEEEEDGPWFNMGMTKEEKNHLGDYGG